MRVNVRAFACLCVYDVCVRVYVCEFVRVRACLCVWARAYVSIQFSCIAHKFTKRSRRLNVSKSHNFKSLKCMLTKLQLKSVKNKIFVFNVCWVLICVFLAVICFVCRPFCQGALKHYLISFVNIFSIYFIYTVQ